MPQATRPNVLMIVADDQRFDTIGALGNDHIQTPHLDSLVEEGCAFTHHHNMGADRMAVCVPARSMIHSGTSLFQLDGPGGMTTAHPTLSESFGNAGYRTFGTGKWHNGTNAFNRCFDEGNTIFFGGMGNHWNVPVIDRHPDGEYPSPVPHRFDAGTGRVETIQQIYNRYASGTHSSELFANTTIDFISSHVESATERPFFAYLAAMAPHDPRTAPGEYFYDPDEIPLPDSFQPEHPFDNGRLDVRDEWLEDRPLDPANVRRHISDYYGMITHLDAQVGRLLETLEKAGERENTIVVFTADHGLAVGQHGLLGKQNLYDHSVRIPLVLAGPGIPENEQRDALTAHYDLYPTLCELAGLDIAETVEGQSLVPTLENAENAPRESLLLAYEDVQRAVREEQFKLIEYHVNGGRRTQLFDLKADPKETRDISEEGYNSEIKKLQDTLGKLQKDMGDPLRSC